MLGAYQLQAKKYKRTTLLCVFLGAILAGVGLAKIAPTLSGGWPIVVGIAAVASIRRRNIVTVYLLVLFGVAVGCQRGGVMQAQVAPYGQLTNKTVTVQIVADSSAVYNQTTQLEFDASHVKLLVPYQQSLPGRMVIAGFGSNSILRGDVVQVTGKMRPRRGGKQAGISFARITMVSRSSSVIEKLRRDFLAGLATALPEPHDQFAAGLLIGQRSEIPQYVSTTLQVVGLSHVIAVSGYNLTILADVSKKRFGKKSKFRGTVLGLSLVFLFVLFAGSSASIARAAFVSVLSIVATHYGRQVKPLLLILLAAATTAYLNPLNVWGDIGWYLSFLAFFGVLVIAPILQKRFFVKREPGLLASILLETSSAQIMTIPIMLFIFGQLSLVSLVSNILVVPLVPIAMLFSFIAGLAGMLVPTLAGIIAWPAKIVLSFMLQISSLLAQVPHAMVQTSITTGTMLALYGSIILFALLLYKKGRTSVKIGAE